MSAQLPAPGGETFAADVHVCGTCACPMVQPLEWQTLGASHWQITLRCPNCEWVGTGVYDATEVEAFDEQLELGTDQILADLHTLAFANFEAQAEQFIAALHADLICPEDF